MANNTDNKKVLILHLRPSRKKAREAALAELVSLLRGMKVDILEGGPLSEVSGVAWLAISKENLEEAKHRINRLGYIQSIDVVNPSDEYLDEEAEQIVRWKNQNWVLERIYNEPRESLNAVAPHSRSFLLECGDGVVREIKGYRGGKGDLEHRALPVEDTRLLVNLVYTKGTARLLDPFAGAGGVIIEANNKNFETVSMDIDPALRFGLAKLSSRHVVGNATSMPFDDNYFDAVATEPPYHISVKESVLKSIYEVARVLKPGGHAAYLVSDDQKDEIKIAGAAAGLELELETIINRKGTNVCCLLWVKQPTTSNSAE